jgi:oligopeptide transport system substrate-binding protein
MEDPVDKSVTPFRLIVDYTKNGEAITNAFEAGEIFFVGDIPLSARSKYTLKEWEKKATVTDALSTHTYILNENAEIKGEKIFANDKVRAALSLAINREEISNAVVFAKPATGIVPNGVFNANTKSKTFREEASNSIATTANKDAALAKLSEANINPSKYAFSISVPAYDEVHLKIAEMVAASWNELGFKVTVKSVSLKDNTDKALTTNEVIPGVKDDEFINDIASGNFEVAAIDYVALSADAFSTLAPFAKGYAGTATASHNSPVFEVKPHISGYNSESYNEKIMAAEKEVNPNGRAELLHEAEDILMADMPIIPVVFNMNVTMQSDELSKTDVTYYQTNVFTNTKQKNYEQYLTSAQ